MALTPSEIADMAANRALVLAEEKRRAQPFYAYFRPKDHEAYKLHLSFFAAGAKYRERAFVAGNRVGKSVTGAYETTCHLTGQYPAWWKGRRFDRPIRAWAAGDTSKTVRDIIQAKLLGSTDPPEQGMIPIEFRGGQVNHRGLPGAVESISVPHISGGSSSLTFKSYDQKRESFQGTELDLIWLDEECPLDIYIECLTRTMTSNGIVILTFTPLMGLTKVVESFLPGGLASQCPAHKFVLQVNWDNAPHLTPEMKESMLSSYPAHQRLVRSTGIPQLGAGAIYQVPEGEIVVDPFPIPDHWKRASGTDNSGFNWRAIVWGALDPATDVLYIYDAWKRERVEPAVHIAAMQGGKGKDDKRWIPGVYDPAANYRDVGIKTFQPADNDVEAGLYDVDKRLTEGRLKIFRSCSTDFLNEYRVYRRDEKGRIVKENDDLMDSLRYLVRSGLAIARAKPHDKPVARDGGGNLLEDRSGDWMRW